MTNVTEASPTITQLAEKLGHLLLSHNKFLTTAESCTGGWVAQVITAIPGSSNWFERGFVTYSNIAKQEMLGVQQSTLDNFGAVSEQTCREMAEGALRHSHAQLSVAITGVAGPTGATAEKPIGLVWLAWAEINFATQAQAYQFQGDRTAIRHQAVVEALQGLTSRLTKR
ncbi:nicotinamide-nucleotide amidase [soil metagenome]